MGEPDHIAMAAEVSHAAAAGIMTPNELREMLGMEPVTCPVLPVEQKPPAAEQGNPVAGRKPHPWTSVPGATGLSLSNHHHHTPLKPY